MGVYPLAGTLDHVGFFTRTVDDMAYAFAVLADEVVDLPAVDPRTGIEPVSRPRLAIVRPPFWDRASEEQQNAFRFAVEALEQAGTPVEVLTLPERYWQSADATQAILAAEASAIHQALIAASPDKVSSRLKDLAAEGLEVKAVDYIKACELQIELRHDFTEQIDGFDAVLTVPAAGEAPEGLAETGDASFCAPWTFLGVPALNVPAGRSKKGLPLGVQVVGPYLEDAHTLKAAKWIETILTASQTTPEPTFALAGS